MLLAAYASLAALLAAALGLELFSRRTPGPATNPAFARFQHRFLRAYLPALAADWLQGPYLYKLYHHYRFVEGQIAILYVCGFASAVLLGPPAALLVDRLGRRASCVLFSLSCAACCLTKLSRDYLVLAAGRVLGGLATALLFSAFEAWYVHEHVERHDFPAEWLAGTFARAAFWNNVLAVGAGVVATALAEWLGLGPVAPFMAAIPLLALAAVLVLKDWEENRGPPRALAKTCGDGLRCLLADGRVLLLGTVQALFESVVYIFIFLWTPVLDPHGPPLGIVFSSFMAASMLGSVLQRVAVQSNLALIQKLSEELLAKWLSLPEAQHIPLCQHMLGFAMKSVTQTAMGSSFEDDQEVIRFRRHHDAIWSEIGKGFLDGSLDKNATRKKLYEDALKEMESTLRKVIKERRGRSFNRHVFIDTLLQGNLSDQQILEDTMIFSLAGCIITANLCTWAVYFLTTSEDVQQNLCKEVDHVLGKGPITHEKIEQLRYCRQVLCETVRTAKLTPIAAQLQELEGRVDQHTVPKETLVLYALGVMLQDSSSWPSPYKFDPERFSEDSAMTNFSLLGFSGSQECPELRFAYMVATVLLSILVRKLYLHPVKGQVMETKYELVTSPKEEAWITVSKRS